MNTTLATGVYLVLTLYGIGVAVFLTIASRECWNAARFAWKYRPYRVK